MSEENGLALTDEQMRDEMEKLALNSSKSFIQPPEPWPEPKPEGTLIIDDTGQTKLGDFIIASHPVESVSFVSVKGKRNYPEHVKNSLMVREFMQLAGQPMLSNPGFPEKKIGRLRIMMILEEVWELIKAFRRRDLVETADALADILYVVYGMAHAMGVDIDSCFREVHRSNLTKDFTPVEGGRKTKVVKGSNYQPPDLRRVMGL